MKNATAVLVGLLASTALGGRAAAADWEGPYVGVNAGYGWGENTVAYTPNDGAAFDGTTGGIGGGTSIPPAGLDLDGPLVGAQAGYNWRAGSSVILGLEADFNWMDADDAAQSPFHLGSTQTGTADATLGVDWLATVRARAGVMAGSVLVYATGGLAVGHVENTLSVPNVVTVGTGGQITGGFSYRCSAGGPPCFDGAASGWETGWTVGAGAEVEVSSRATMKLEYLYVDLGDESGVMTALDAFAGTTPASFTGDFGSVNFSIIRAGLNIRF